MTPKTKYSLAAASVAFGAWFYATPYLAVLGMKTAADAGDVAKFSRYVDFPALKKSVKENYNGESSSKVRKSFFSTMGSAMAAVVVNPLVDSMVTPERLLATMKGNAKSNKADSGLDTSLSYESLNRFVVTVKKKGNSEGPVGLIFSRKGLTDWKLSAVRLPD